MQRLWILSSVIILTADAGPSGDGRPKHLEIRDGLQKAAAARRLTKRREKRAEQVAAAKDDEGEREAQNDEPLPEPDVLRPDTEEASSGVSIAGLATSSSGVKVVNGRAVYDKPHEADDTKATFSKYKASATKAISDGVTKLKVLSGLEKDDDAFRFMVPNLNLSKRTSRRKKEMPRIAHCMAGNHRFLCDNRTYTTFADHVVRPSAGKAVQDIFLVAEDDFDPDHYPKAMDALQKSLNGGTLEYAAVSGDQFDRHRKCFEMIKRAEVVNGKPYDYVVKSRPDLFFLQSIPDVDQFPTVDVWFRPYLHAVLEHLRTWNGTVDYFFTNFTDGTRTWYRTWLNKEGKEFGFSEYFFVMPRSKAKAMLFHKLSSDCEDKKCVIERMELCGDRADTVDCVVKVAAKRGRVGHQFRPFRLRKVMGRGYSCLSEGAGVLFEHTCEDHLARDCAWAPHCGPKGKEDKTSWWGKVKRKITTFPARPHEDAMC